MSIGNYELIVDQGGTLVFQMEFVQDGGVLPVTDVDFKGLVKNSVYDTDGFPFRFEKINYRTVNVYLDASVTSQFDFTEGVYDIQMIHTGDLVTPFLGGKVTVTPRATLNG